MRKALVSFLVAITFIAVSVCEAKAGEFEDALAVFSSGKYATAAKLFRPLAVRGNAAAQYNLGQMFERGVGVKQDYDEALMWLRQSAESGYVLAQGMACNLYNEGFTPDGGVDEGNFKLARAPNYTEALKWCHRAAANCHTGSLLELGHMYKFGNGVKRDNVQAYKWFEIVGLKLGDSAPRTMNWVLLELATKERAALAAIMSSSEIAEARKLARQWTPG